MNEMTLSSRHRIQNSSPGGLRPSTLPLGHEKLPTKLSFTRGCGRNIFVSFETGNRTLDPSVKGSSANHYPRANESWNKKEQTLSGENKHIFQSLGMNTMIIDGDCCVMLVFLGS